MQRKLTFPPSELIINEDGSVFHLHVRPEQLADKVILVGDPGRVNLVAFALRHERVRHPEPRVSYHQPEHTKASVSPWSLRVSDADNIDIVLNELDALANIDFGTT